MKPAAQKIITVKYEQKKIKKCKVEKVANSKFTENFQILVK